MNDEPTTCGQGVAEQAGLPAKLGDLVAALAVVLEVHSRTLVLEDRNARLEHEAYSELARRQREIATQLHAVASLMAGYRDLPMGEHDEGAMAAPEALEAFREFVTLEQDLVSWLQGSVTEGQDMLAQMDP